MFPLKMVNTSQIVEKIIKQKPFLQEALSKGIINNAALAEQLIPIAKKELGKDVKFSAVNMAIRRLSEKLSKSFVGVAKFDNKSDIIIRSNLIEITIYKTETNDIEKLIHEVYDLIDIKYGDFLTITQGLHEIMFITNDKYKKGILEIIPNKSIKKTIENLSSLTINIPVNSIETVGLFYIVCRALNWENINIVDIVSTLTEMTFIVNESDTSRAYDTLQNLIKENQR